MSMIASTTTITFIDNTGDLPSNPDLKPVAAEVLHAQLVKLNVAAA